MTVTEPNLSTIEGKYVAATVGKKCLFKTFFILKLKINYFNKIKAQH